MGQNAGILVGHTHKGCCLHQPAQSSHQAHVEQPQVPPTTLCQGFPSLQCQNSSQLLSCNPFTARELQQRPKQQILTQNKGEWQHKPLFLRAYGTSEAEQGILPTFSQLLTWGCHRALNPAQHFCLTNPSVHELQLQGKANRTQILCF